MTLLETTPTEVFTIDEWATRIRNGMVKTVQAIIEVGQTLVECKASVDHGDFGRCLEVAGISPRVAQMFMRVARNPVLSKCEHSSHLPPALHSLYELTKVEDGRLQLAIDTEVITSSTALGDVRTIVSREKTGVPVIGGQEQQTEAGAPHLSLVGVEDAPPETSWMEVVSACHRPGPEAKSKRPVNTVYRTVDMLVTSAGTIGSVSRVMDIPAVPGAHRLQMALALRTARTEIGRLISELEKSC